MGLAFTITVMSPVVMATPSLAVNRNTYVPPAENPAVVDSALAFPNVTVPGPLILLHVVVNVALGNPSSLAAPAKATELVGNVIV